MDLKDIKKQEKEFIKNSLLSYYIQYHKIVSFNKSQIENEITKSLEIINLNNLDYIDIKNEICNTLLAKEKITNEYNTIVKTLIKKAKSHSYKIDIDDSDIYIYFNLNNNTSYLINYDSINKTWYLSLIETETLSLIKEIYNNTYEKFILFLNNLKSR